MPKENTKMVSEYVTSTEPQCNRCKHQDQGDPFRCLAFPGGIPMEILLNKVSHKKPYKGDNGIQFEEKT